ncbi:hypothetical protein ACHAXT_009785 [Thalassiosira profunda]
MPPNTALAPGALAHDETQLWKDLSVDSWKNSVRSPDSVFYDLYNDTRGRIIEACQRHTYDVVVEVGCGTGEVIGFLAETGTPRIGVDINEDFINHCKSAYKDQELEFHVADAMKLDQWWTDMGYDKKYKAPLMVCPNNTIMIMPEEIRDGVIDKMRVVAGVEGRIVVTYWNGRMFAHGVMGYYRKNSDLCGTFDLTDEHVDWENKKIETRTSYKSEWPTSQDVRRWMASLHIDVDIVEPEMKETPEIDHIAEVGMGVFLWLKGVADSSSMGSARDYYDNKDSQTFYRTVWGENNIHIGRHDLIAKDPELASAPVRTRIQKAQDLQEESFMEMVKAHYGGAKVRCMDMGCGYGGLLRNMARSGLIWTAVGVDISGEMVDAAARLSKDIPELTFYRESYMNTSIPTDGMDLCISTEAFLHVGPGNHEAVLREAWRVLRPGGRLIFTDIVGHPNAPEEAQQLYERIGLQSFQTVEGYFDVARKLGFGDLSFEDHSENVGTHYGMILDALEMLWEKNEIKIKEESKDRMVDGLQKWRDLAPSCLQWGIIGMRKLEQTEHSVLERPPTP